MGSWGGGAGFMGRGGGGAGWGGNARTGAGAGGGALGPAVAFLAAAAFSCFVSLAAAFFFGFARCDLFFSSFFAGEPAFAPRLVVPLAADVVDGAALWAWAGCCCWGGGICSC